MSRLTSLSFFTSKISITIIVTTLIWAVSDFSNRILTSPTLNKKENRTIELAPLQLPRLNDDTLEHISTSYLKYNLVDKDPISKNLGMSAEEQAKQQGELNSLFVDENKIELKAVIKNEEEQNENQYVLLLIHNLKTDSIDIKKFKQGSLVHGYMLRIEKNTEIILTKETEQGQQTIILNMYSTS